MTEEQTCGQFCQELFSSRTDVKIEYIIIYYNKFQIRTSTNRDKYCLRNKQNILLRKTDLWTVSGTPFI